MNPKKREENDLNNTSEQLMLVFPKGLTKVCGFTLELQVRLTLYTKVVECVLCLWDLDLKPLVSRQI